MKLLSSLLLLILAPSLAFSFITPVDSIPKKLESFSLAYNQEKLYIHTDRKFYAPQESIWLKAYLVNSYDHRPSSLSKTIYVELIAPDKSLVSKIRLYSRRGLPFGQITLPDSLANGTYTLRAYTNWMKNAGEEFLFYKEIEVYAGIKTDLKNDVATDDKIVQILPEGGQLVENVASRVAIKSPFDSLFFYANDQLVSTLTTIHNNSTLLSFTPKPQTKYTLKNKSGREFSFPKIQKQGFTLTVNPNLYDLVNITVSTNAATSNRNNLLLLVHTRGKVGHASTINLSDSTTTTISVHKNDLEAGISHITLFNKSNLPLAERIFFLKKERKEVELQTDKPIYTDRDKVSIDVKLIDRFGRPLQGNFSLAAVDVALVPNPKLEEDIETNLLLKSDLKGHIKNPIYYFESNTATIKEHLDLLMMTHGWSRYTWQDVIKQNIDSSHQVETGIIVSGQVVKAHNGKPIANGEVVMANINNNPYNYEKTNFDEYGRFTFEPQIMYDNASIGFMGINEKEKDITNASFVIDSTINFQKPNYLPTENAGAFILNSEIEQKARERLLIEEAYNFDTTARRLDDVVVEGRRARITQELSPYGAGSVTIEMDEIPTRQKLNKNILELIQGKVAGVYGFGLGRKGEANVLNIRGAVSAWSEASPTFFLDDNIISENVGDAIDFLNGIPTTDIQRVEVFKGPEAAIFGAKSANGVIAIYTYVGGSSYEDNHHEDQRFETMLKNAYQGPREFFAPNYSEELPEHIKPDRRVLVHWEPSITTDREGKATVEFYTTDNETTIQLDLQGITPYGRPLTLTKLIDVEKSKN